VEDMKTEYWDLGRWVGGLWWIGLDWTRLDDVLGG
jgi:hypothetical protein